MAIWLTRWAPLMRAIASGAKPCRELLCKEWSETEVIVISHLFVWIEEVPLIHFQEGTETLGLMIRSLCLPRHKAQATASKKKKFTPVVIDNICISFIYDRLYQVLMGH